MLKNWRIPQEVPSYQAKMQHHYSRLLDCLWHLSRTVGDEDRLRWYGLDATQTERIQRFKRECRRTLTNWQNVARCLSACNIAIEAKRPELLRMIYGAPLLPTSDFSPQYLNRALSASAGHWENVFYLGPNMRRPNGTDNVTIAKLKARKYAVVGFRWHVAHPKYANGVPMEAAAEVTLVGVPEVTWKVWL